MHNQKWFKVGCFTMILLGVCIPIFSQVSSSNSLKEKAAEAFLFCTKNKMDTTQCILINMGIHSGKNRLFVWDFKTNQVVSSGLCCHGSCDGKTSISEAYNEAKFSNTAQSYCSSKGKYKIGSRGYSNWGIHINYKLHGLESTNNNAYKRIIVLHSWNDVPENEIYPDYAPNSLGCPMVSNSMMKYLDQTLQSSTLPLLLWVYD